MKLGQAESLGMLDDHDRGVGHVDPHLDHRGGHQDLDLPGKEGSHDAVLLLPGHLAVDETHRELGKLLPIQPLEFLRRRLQVHLLGALHQGVDDVGLPALRHLVRNEPGHLGPGLGIAEDGPHGRPARRELVEHAQVQLAVEGQGQGPGDGRGRHDEDVRCGIPLRQRHPLPHAETVLLVHDHQPEAVEGHPLLDQGMRPHDQGSPARGQRRQGVPALRRPEPPRQERDFQPQGLHEAAESPGMLLRQDLRGSHEDGLPPSLRRQEHGEEGHERLARPHVPLEHAVHPPTGGHVRGDLLQHPRLGVRECEGEGLVQGPDQLVGPGMGDPGALLGVPVPDLGLDQLEEEELVEGEALPPDLRFRQRARTVQRRQRFSQAQEPEPLPLPFRQVFLPAHQPQEIVQVLLHDPPEDPLGDVLAGRIGHEDGAGVGGPLPPVVPGSGPPAPPLLPLPPFLPGAGHEDRLPGLELGPVVEPDRTGHQYGVSLPELPVEPRLPRPGHRDPARVVLDDGLEDLEAGTGRKNPLLPDPPDDGGVHPHVQAADGPDRGGVVVAARHVIEQMPGRDQPHPGQRLGAPRAHPLQELDRLVQKGEVHGVVPHVALVTRRRRRPPRRPLGRRSGGPPHPPPSPPV